MKAILMIDSNAWLQQTVIRELQETCEVEVADVSNTSFIEADVLICWQASKGLINNIKGLKLIQVWGAGIDKVDISATKERNIIVCNTKGAMANAIAEYVVMQILVWERDLPYWNKIAHMGQWNWEMRNSNPFVELNERILVVIGLGMIGMEVAKKAANLGLKVCGITKNPLKVGEDEKKQLCLLGGLEEMEGVMIDADYISLHLPLTNETHHLVNNQFLKQMKPSSVLINTSRGGLIDENALSNILRNRQIRGASLDVLTNEPERMQIAPIFSPLNGLENVILTCHQAGYTTRAIKNTIDMIKTNIRAIKEGDESRLINRIG
ncbi:MAG: NAD(P)-dependent oxidoreductase [bacterium]|nr:NAD(P)-dependent oxidoreductase [bacterium]